MKRTTVFLIILILLTGMAFANPNSEQQIITAAGARSPSYLDALAIFQFNNNVKIEHIDIDITTGESITVDVLLAAGTPPDILINFIGRSGKYLRPDYALPLTIDETLYDTDILSMCIRDGVLYALPGSFPGQAMAINTSMTKGWIPDEDWTIDDFVNACRILRGQAVDGYFASGLFAANPSGDYLYINWFGAFGVEFFEDGDYTKSSFNTAKAVKAFSFLKMLVDEGYVDPMAATMTDDDYVAQWAEGKIAFAPLRPGWENFYVKGAIEAGKLEEAFGLEFVPFPHDPSIEGTPTAGGGSLAVAHKTDDKEKAKLLTDILLAVTGPVNQFKQVMQGNFPSRTDLFVINSNKDFQVVERIANRFGFMDVGYPNNWYNESRPVMPEVLRDLYNDVITPEQAAEIYANRIDEIIAEAK